MPLCGGALRLSCICRALHLLPLIQLRVGDPAKCHTTWASCICMRRNKYAHFARVEYPDRIYWLHLPEYCSCRQAGKAYCMYWVHFQLTFDSHVTYHACTLHTHQYSALPHWLPKRKRAAVCMVRLLAIFC